MLVHTICGYHAIGNAGNLLQIVGGAGRNFSEENLLGSSSTQGHTNLVVQLIGIIQILFSGGILCVSQCCRTARNDGNFQQRICMF